MAGEGGFWDFRTLVSNSIVKAVYGVGALLLTLGGLFLIAFPLVVHFNRPSDQAQSFFATSGVQWLIAGAVALTLGNLFWRLLCEAWIVLFNLHEMLASIEERVERAELLAAEQSGVLADLLRAIETNTEARHEETLAALRAPRGREPADPDETLVSVPRRRP